LIRRSFLWFEEEPVDWESSEPSDVEEDRLLMRENLLHLLELRPVAVEVDVWRRPLRKYERAGIELVDSEASTLLYDAGVFCAGRCAGNADTKLILELLLGLLRQLILLREDAESLKSKDVRLGRRAAVEFRTTDSARNGACI
jgi:hypothetical protein